MTDLTALALVCTLKTSEEPSSSELLARQLLDALAVHGCRGETVRVVDHPVRFGVSTDEGDGDAWPSIRRRVLAADVLVVATPIWMGQPSSVCTMVLERLDAELAESDDDGRPTLSGTVGAIAVVGNEDGAHHVTAEVAQALLDVGVTLPAQAATYWVGEAMAGVDYRDLEHPPEATAEATRTLARHAAHLARLLRDAPYPLG